MYQQIGKGERLPTTGPSRSGEIRRGVSRGRGPLCDESARSRLVWRIRVPDLQTGRSLVNSTVVAGALRVVEDCRMSRPTSAGSSEIGT
jgi:hypothetical protein